MFEQSKTGGAKLKASSSHLDDVSAPSSDVLSHSPAKNDAEPLEKDCVETGNDAIDTTKTPGESSMKLGGKKTPEFQATEDLEPEAIGESNCPPTKRARTDNKTMSSTKSASD